MIEYFNLAILLILSGVVTFIFYKVNKLESDNKQNINILSSVSNLILELSKISSATEKRLSGQAEAVTLVAEHSKETQEELAKFKTLVGNFVMAVNQQLQALSINKVQKSNVFNSSKKNDKIKPN